VNDEIDIRMTQTHGNVDFQAERYEVIRPIVNNASRACEHNVSLKRKPLAILIIRRSLPVLLDFEPELRRRSDRRRDPRASLAEIIE
jgi:hypothetical protein